jgi:hypothetical protein
VKVFSHLYFLLLGQHPWRFRIISSVLWASRGPPLSFRDRQVPLSKLSSNPSVGGLLVVSSSSYSGLPFLLLRSFDLGLIFFAFFVCCYSQQYWLISVRSICRGTRHTGSGRGLSLTHVFHSGRVRTSVSLMPFRLCFWWMFRAVSSGAFYWCFVSLFYFQPFIYLVFFLSFSLKFTSIMLFPLKFISIFFIFLLFFLVVFFILFTLPLFRELHHLRGFWPNFDRNSRFRQNLLIVHFSCTFFVWL